jgi:hypothetical protein
VKVGLLCVYKHTNHATTLLLGAETRLIFYFLFASLIFSPPLLFLHSDGFQSRARLRAEYYISPVNHVALFNSIGAGVSLNGGRLELTTNEKGDVITREMYNSVRFAGGC